MTLQILIYPDPRLRQVASPVTVVDNDIRELAKKMLDTMYEFGGVGLASTQVNILHRIIVMDCSEKQDSPHILVNPEIIHAEGKIAEDEGCLSFPGVYGKVERAQKVRVRYLDENGHTQELEADGLLGRCVQHEIDHLNGKVYVDYLSVLKRGMIRRKMEKYNRLHKSHHVY